MIQLGSYGHVFIGYYIPAGLKGDSGDAGPSGPKGDRGS